MFQIGSLMFNVKFIGKKKRFGGLCNCIFKTVVGLETNFQNKLKCSIKISQSNFSLSFISS